MSQTVMLHHRQTQAVLSGSRQTPLVVLHGLYGSGANWSPIARRLGEQRRIVTVDLRNHGRSPQAQSMAYTDQAADVIALLDSLNLARVDLLGHSMGGKVAMMVALRAGTRLRRLVVADMAPVAYPMVEHGRIIATLRGLDLHRLTSRQDADAALAGTIPDASVRQFLLANLQRDAGGWQWRIPLDILQDQLSSIGGFQPPAGAVWSGPALFLRGERSDYVGTQHHSVIKQLFPTAAIDTLADTGHWLHADDPDAFCHRIDAFLTP